MATGMMACGVTFIIQRRFMLTITAITHTQVAGPLEMVTLEYTFT